MVTLEFNNTWLTLFSNVKTSIRQLRSLMKPKDSIKSTLHGEFYRTHRNSKARICRNDVEWNLSVSSSGPLANGRLRRGCQNLLVTGRTTSRGAGVPGKPEFHTVDIQKLEIGFLSDERIC